MFTKKFGSYVCEGDTIKASHKGIDLIATIIRDPDYQIDDDDSHNIDQSVTGCDDAQQKELLAAREAWLNGEWFYCGIVISGYVDGILINDHAASLWGIECNYPRTDNSYLVEVANELLEEAIDQLILDIEKMKQSIIQLTKEG